MSYSTIARVFVAAIVFLLPLSQPQAKEPLVVVSSIKPVHLLVLSVVKDTPVEAKLLMPASASVHHYALATADAKLLSRADIVFYIHPQMEAFLQKSFTTLAEKAQKVALAEGKGITILPTRNYHEDDHEHGHEHEEHHVHGSQDLHIWLGTQNARVMVKHIADALAAKDPEYKTRFEQNAAEMILALDDLDSKLEAKLKPYAHSPYMVYHDAYQYFEAEYGLSNRGALTLAAEQSLGAKTMKHLVEQIKHDNIQCIFGETQHIAPTVKTIADTTGIRHVDLDPMGAPIADAPDGYIQLIRAVAEEFTSCLEPHEKGSHDPSEHTKRGNL